MAGRNEREPDGVMSEKPTSKSRPESGPRREFAFSRIAGATPSDYAAVSSSAVAAVIVALMGVAAMAMVWGPVLARSGPITQVDPTLSLGLAVPAGIALLLAVLATWYIATSAGTLTGLKVAAVAAGLALLSGGTALALHLKIGQQRQADIDQARDLGGQMAALIAAGDYDAAYEQLDESYRRDVPLSYWRYEWRRFFDVRGAASKVELSDRAWFLPSGQVRLTMHIHLPPPPGLDADEPAEERGVSVPLLYGRPAPEEHAEQTHDGPSGAHHPAELPPPSGEWRLVNLPGLITPLPPLYPEPLVWPAPGPLRMIIRDRGSPATRVRQLRAGQPIPTTRPDQELELLADEPWVPRVMFERPWLTVRPPPAPVGHRH